MTITELPPQGPVGVDGLLLHDGDHVAQLALALENLEQALAAAGLTPADLVELRVRTIDRRLLDDAYEVLTDRLAEHGVRPTITITEVPRLDQPGMTVSVQASATDHPATDHRVTDHRVTDHRVTDHRPVHIHPGELMTIELTDDPAAPQTAPSPTAPADALRGLCGGRVHLPGDPGHDQARTPWAVRVDQRPAAVAVPHSAEEVVEIVRASVAAGLRLAPQSSGHGAGPLAGADLSDVVLVSLRELTGVTIDPERRVARVLGGTVLQAVVDAAAAYGLAARHGSSPDVSVAGYTLGGGLSWFARQHGLAAHHLTAVEIVLADGRLVRADAEQEPDLFWAVRGGGGSFGIVTALEFSLLPITDVYAGMLLWPGDRAAEVAQVWAAWTATVPESVTTAVRLMSFPPLPELPPFLSGRSLVVVDSAVLESDERAADLLGPLRALGPEMDTFGRIPAAALTRVHMDPEGPTPSVSDSVLLADLPADAVAALVAAAGPDSGSRLLAAEIRQLGGAVGRPGEGALAALPGGYLGFFVAIAPTDEAAAAGSADAARAVEALAPWASGGRCLNFDDADRAVDTSAAYRADDWSRLQRIRSVVDPHRRLVANHAV